MAVSWDTPGPGGRSRPRPRTTGIDGGNELCRRARRTARSGMPALPPSVAPGGHGGSHGHLMNEFVTAILQDRKPLVDIAMALNMTVPGIVAHQSALKDGESMKIPQFA